MSEIAILTTDLAAIGTLLAQLLTLVLVAALMFPAKAGEILKHVRPFIIPAAFLLTLGASILSLVYSDVFGIAPCGLCWLQRALLYPMPILLGIAYFAKDTGVWKYVVGLGIPGLLIALYQHYLQMGGVGTLPCPAAPGAADCAQRVIFEFGYITFPLMAATVFALTIALMFLLRKRASA